MTDIKPRIQVQIQDGNAWRTVAHREGSEMDYPEPVPANEIGVSPGDICRLALTYDTTVVRKRFVTAVS